MSTEAMKLALEALEYAGKDDFWRYQDKAIAALREALAKPAQPKYRRGDRLICLETEEYCVIHISGTDRQWVKFPTSYIGVYTNEQVAELFELLPKEPAQQQPEPVAWIPIITWRWNNNAETWEGLTNTSPPARKPLTDEEIERLASKHLDVGDGSYATHFVTGDVAFTRAIEAAHGIKGGA